MSLSFSFALLFGYFETRTGELFTLGRITVLGLLDRARSSNWNSDRPFGFLPFRPVFGDLVLDVVDVLEVQTQWGLGLNPRYGPLAVGLNPKSI